MVIAHNEANYPFYDNPLLTNSSLLFNSASELILLSHSLYHKLTYLFRIKPRQKIKSKSSIC